MQTNLLFDTSCEDSYPDRLLKLESVRDLIDKISNHIGDIAIDTEFSAFDTTAREMWGFSLAFGDVAVYVPTGHRLYNDDGQRNTRNLPFEAAKSILEAVYKKTTGTGYCLVAHNLVAELTTLEVFGCPIPEDTTLADTMIAAWILSKGVPMSFKLKDLAQSVLGVTMQHFHRPDAFTDRLLKFGAYAADDTAQTLALWSHYSEQLRGQPFERAYWHVEIPIMRVIAHMKISGFNVEREFFGRAFDEYNQRIEVEQQRLDSIIQGKFPSTSPQAISKMMFDDLGWWTPQGERGANGAYSTKAEVLEEMKKKAPEQRGRLIAELLLKIRSLTTGRDRYTHSLADEICTDGRIRGSFMSHGTVTGRFSSSGPNMQNLPRPGEAKKKGLPVIRSAFIASENWDLIVADYSQVELRLMAHYSQDPALLDAYCNGRDVHQQTADACGCSRQDAKPINFGLIYGMSPRTLTTKIDADERTAASYHRGYFRLYKGVKAFQEKTIQEARHNGYVSTLTGRQRLLPDINKQGWRRGAAEREAVNTVIQGTAADLMKLAMIGLYRRWTNPQKYGPGAPELGKTVRILATVHDELACEAPKHLAQRVSDDMKEVFEDAVRLTVPLLAEPNTGHAWSDAK